MSRAAADSLRIATRGKAIPPPRKRLDVQSGKVEPETTLSEDEQAVIGEIRKTPFGKVTVALRDSRIVEIKREETIKPPSLLHRAEGSSGR